MTDGPGRDSFPAGATVSSQPWNGPAQTERGRSAWAVACCTTRSQISWPGVWFVDRQADSTG